MAYPEQPKPEPVSQLDPQLNPNKIAPPESFLAGHRTVERDLSMPPQFNDLGVGRDSFPIGFSFQHCALFARKF
jgi:hypothetical protein